MKERRAGLLKQVVVAAGVGVLCVIWVTQAVYANWVTRPSKEDRKKYGRRT